MTRLYKIFITVLLISTLTMHTIQPKDELHTYCIGALAGSGLSLYSANQAKKEYLTAKNWDEAAERLKLKKREEQAATYFAQMKVTCERLQLNTCGKRYYYFRSLIYLHYATLCAVGSVWCMLSAYEHYKYKI